MLIRWQESRGFKAGLLISLISLSIYTSWFIIHSWRSDWQLAHHKTSPVALLKSQPDDQVAQVNALPLRHLFGQAIHSVGNMPLTNLQLHLTGIVHGYAESKAYIAIASQPGKIYRTGDRLSDGAKIYAITDDTVVLQNDGRLEKITLARHPLEFKTNSKVEL